MKKLQLTCLMLLISTSVYARQDIFRSNEVTSPEINEDKTVTFRLVGPEATSVTVSGSWMSGEGFGGTPAVAMEKKGDSLWTYTTPVLEPEFYRYTFSVNGVRTPDPANAHAIRDVARISSVFLVEGGIADYYKVQDVPHGTVSFPWYHSPGNDKMRRLGVYTPPGYESSEREYPVLYLLHGIGGDEEAWLGSGRLAQIMDNLIDNNEAEPMIVVMPNGNVSQEASPGDGSSGFITPTFRLPHTMDGKFEETFVDVMNFVEDTYRTKGEKSSRAIAGLSMGGFHAANISMNYPDTFDYIGLFSSALGVQQGPPPSSPMYQNKDEKLEQQMENDYELYWMGMGVDDMPMIYQGNADFRKKMDDMGMDYVYKETDGGHTWDNWRKYLVEFSQLIFKN